MQSFSKAFPILFLISFDFLGPFFILGTKVSCLPLILNNVKVNESSSAISIKKLSNLHTYRQEIIKNSTPVPQRHSQEEDILSDDDDDNEIDAHEPSTIFVNRNSKSASAQLSSNHRQPRSYSNETSTLKIPLFEHILLNSSRPTHSPITTTNESNINNDQANNNNNSNSNAAASSSRSRSSTFSSSSHESLNEITKNANDDKNDSLLALGKGVFLQNVFGSILKKIP